MQGLPLLATTAVTLAVLAAVVVLRWCDHRESTTALRLVDDEVTSDDVTALELAGPHARPAVLVPGPFECTPARGADSGTHGGGGAGRISKKIRAWLSIRRQDVRRR